MLLLMEARLVEVCQYVDKRIEFGPGLILIVGDNGTGKSNLVNAIRASLTNDFSQMGGVKSDNIRRLKQESVPSFVETTWRVDAGVMTVRRGLEGIRSSISLNGKELVSGKEEKITAEVMRLIGLTPAQINDFLFAAQDQLQDVISGNKSRRAELFKSLCGLEKLDRVDRYLRDSVQKDKAVIEHFDNERLDQQMLKFAELKQKLKELNKQIKDLQDRRLSEEESRRLNDLLGQYLRRKSEIAQYRRAKDRLRKNVAALSDSEEDYALLGDKLEFAQDRLEQLKDKRLEVAQHLKDARVRSTMYRDFIDSEKILASEAPQPVAEPDTTSEENLIRDKYRKQQDIKSLSSAIELIESGDQVNCDVCFAPLNDDKAQARKAELQERLTSCKAELSSIEEELSAVLEAKRAWSRYEKEMRDYESLTAQARQKRQSVLNYFGDEEPADADPDSLSESLNKLIARIEKGTKVVERHQENHSNMIARRAQLEERITNDEVKLKELRKSINSTEKVSTSRKDKISAKLSANGDVIRALEDRLNEKRKLSGVVNSVIGEIRSLRHQRRKISNLSAWVQLAEDSRKVLKKDRLPSLIITSMLGRTNRLVNSYLEQLGVNFRVDAEVKDFAFEAVHNDGTQEPASRLSVGQKTCLAIAFWLARAELFVGSLPFFCLDEPTAHLDSQRVASVADLFLSLSAKLATEQRQGIVITHHTELSRVATKTISLNVEPVQ